MLGLVAQPDLHGTAWLLLLVGVLLAVSVLFSRTSARFGVPVFLLFIAVGMLTGSEGLGIVPFEDYRLSSRLGTIALALILFDGGLNTPLATFRRFVWPAATLATAGVAGTAAVVAVGAHLLGLPWSLAFLLGAIVSSTDAAAVFSVLRASGLQLRERVGATLELESGLNDPMAVILTLTLTQIANGAQSPGAAVLLQVPLQLLIGAAAGVALGLAGRFLLRWSRLPAGGLYPVFTLSLALVTFGLPTALDGSGFLAVYLAGIVLGNSELPYQTGVRRFHDAVAWFCQVAMFLVLGLLSFPLRILGVAGIGVAVALLLAFVARPLVVLLCLLPFRYPRRENLFIGWVGLRGAVPIILATFPVLAGVQGSETLFDIVFFVVVLGAFLPGSTVAWVARRLRLGTKGPPSAPAVLEISSTQVLDGQILPFYMEPALPVCGVSMADIPFPDQASVLLIVRGSELTAPRGDTVLQPGDHVYVFCRGEDRPLVELLFGRAEE